MCMFPKTNENWRAGASIKSGLLDTAAALALVPLKPTTESIGAFSSDFGAPTLTSSFFRSFLDVPCL